MKNNWKNLINKVNCMDALDLFKQIPDKSIDLVVTDPPYGMSFQSGARIEKYKKIENDDNLNWLPEYIKELKRVSKKDSHIYIFCSWHKIDIFKQEVEKHFIVKNIIVWAKNGVGMGDLKGGYGGSHEFCIFINNGKDLNEKRDNDLIKIKRTGNKYHPTEKPIPLLEYLVRKSSEEEDIVLDSFMGSWTTAVACQNLKRNFIGCELDKDYCEIGTQRLDNKHYYNKQIK